MKKTLLLLGCMLMAAFCFAAENKWNPTDLFNKKKTEKLLNRYELTESFSNETMSMFRNEETGDWLLIYKDGDESAFDENVVTIAYGSIGGIFNSCTILGCLLKGESVSPYLYAVITEESTSVPKNNFNYSSNAPWVWRDPMGVFFNMNITRLNYFNWLQKQQEDLYISIPEDVSERYAYFTKWFTDNKDDDKIQSKYVKEYKKYLQDHK